MGSETSSAHSPKTRSVIRALSARRGITVLTLTILLVTALAGCGSSTQPEQGSSGTDASLTLVDTITVSGQGKVLASPDRAVINVGVQTQAPTAAEALEKNSSDVQTLITRLKAEGISEEGIRTSNLGVFPITTYDPQTGLQSTQGYQADNTITITAEDVQTLSTLLAAAAEAGSNYISGIQLSISDDTEASKEALTLAMAAAKAKAETLASAAGVKLGAVLSVRESTVPSTPIYYETQGAGDSGAVPVSGGRLEVSASVDVTFRLTR